MSLVLFPRQITVDVNGTPRAAAKAYFYAPTTTTPITVYTTAAYAVELANPVVASSPSGIFAAVYVNPAVNATYKLVLKDSLDNTIWTEDNIPAGPSQGDVGQALQPRTAAEISAGVTPTNYAYPPGHVLRYGTNTTPGTTNLTTAFAAAEAANDEVIIPAGIFATDTIVTTRAGIKFRTAGFSTVIQQNTGTGSTIPVIQIKHSDCILENCTVKGNIATDSSEFKHGVMVYNASGSLQNVTVGDIYGEDLRGDVLCIVAPSGQTTNHIRFGRIIGKNILRNVVAVVGPCDVRGVASIVDGACGYAALDIEPDTVGSTDVYVGYVKGGVLQCAPPTAATSAYRIHIGMVDLDPAFQPNSTPTYAGYDVSVAVRLRNTVGLTIDYLKIRNHVGLGIKYIWNSGEQKGEGIDIGYLDVSGVGATDVTYNAIIEGANIRSMRIRDGNVTLGAGADYLFLGDGVDKNNELQIDRMQIDGTLVRYARQSVFSNIRVNSVTNVYLLRQVDDSVLQASDITLPNLLLTCANTTLIGVKATCSGTYIGASVTGTTLIGCSGGLASILAGSATYNPSDLADATGETTTVTATGAAVGDFAEASFSEALAGITLTAWVSAANTVSVRFQNESGGNVNLASGTLRVRVRKA